jgi:hypothetical protein
VITAFPNPREQSMVCEGVSGLVVAVTETALLTGETHVVVVFVPITKYPVPALRDVHVSPEPVPAFDG